jgi:hypothetical protein
MRHIKPPERSNLETRIFLAGSIEMGAAEDWQAQISNAFSELSNVVLLNPRREHWDPTWEQSLYEPRFVDQVEWELEMMDRADLIAMYFQPSTKSPITLLEFGLYARSGKLIVCCPEGFWRKGNVDIVCRRYGIMQAYDLQGLVQTIHREILAPRQSK